MTQEEREIAEKALNAFGYMAQEMMYFEESARLNIALARLHRGRTLDPDVITALADISIMVDQLAIYYGEAEFIHARAKKFKRLKELLK